jgi:hypothetical protein
MADVYGKLDFSWVQRSNLCILDPTRISAISKRQLALRQTNPGLSFSVSPCLSGGFLIGGRL